MPTARLVVNTKKRVGVVPAKKMKNELRKAYEAGQLFGNYVTFEEYYNELLNTNEDEDTDTRID
jgi:hypothetical protein